MFIVVANGQDCRSCAVSGESGAGVKPYRHGNHVRLLQCGGEYFPALERAIDGAQREVRLETYIFADDATGRRIAEAMARAVARGVTMRVVHDGFGSVSHIGQIGAWMRGRGIDVAVFRPGDIVEQIAPVKTTPLASQACDD